MASFPEEKRDPRLSKSDTQRKVVVVLQQASLESVKTKKVRLRCRHAAPSRGAGVRPCACTRAPRLRLSYCAHRCNSVSPHFLCPFLPSPSPFFSCRATSC